MCYAGQIFSCNAGQNSFLNGIEGFMNKYGSLLNGFSVGLLF